MSGFSGNTSSAMVVAPMSDWFTQAGHYVEQSQWIFDCLDGFRLSETIQPS